MIASLTGTVAALERSSAVIDVSGVGYLVHMPGGTSAALKNGQEIQLFTSLIVREDGFTLFGFLSNVEQRVFDLLRSVTGVGPKSALAILDQLTVQQIIDAVTMDNDSAFKVVSGIGPKTAKLITLSLAGKLGSGVSVSDKPKSTELLDVVSALTGLGWNERTANDAARLAAKSLPSDSSANDLLKFALSNLGASKSIGAGDE